MMRDDQKSTLLFEDFVSCRREDCRGSFGKTWARHISSSCKVVGSFGRKKFFSFDHLDRLGM
jgi:hypothetical protein